jgi:hypothetical protein
LFFPTCEAVPAVPTMMFDDVLGQLDEWIDDALHGDREAIERLRITAKLAAGRMPVKDLVKVAETLKQIYWEDMTDYVSKN